MSPKEFEGRTQGPDSPRRKRASDGYAGSPPRGVNDGTGGRPDETPHAPDIDPLGPIPVPSRVLLTPFGLTIGYACLAALTGPAAFDPNAPGTGGTVAWLLLGGWVLVSGWATARLHDDASWRAASRESWHPQPWAYVLGGAVTVTLLLALYVGLTDRVVDRPVLVLGGALVASLPLSAVVAGPLYVWNRRRRQGPTKRSQPRQR